MGNKSTQEWTKWAGTSLDLESESSTSKSIFGYPLSISPPKRDFQINCTNCFQKVIDTGLCSYIKCTKCDHLIRIANNYTHRQNQENSLEIIEEDVKVTTGFASCYTALCRKLSFSSTLSPAKLSCLVWYINKDTLYETDVNYNDIIKKILLSFFAFKSRLVQVNNTFKVNNIEFKVISTVPPCKSYGWITNQTLIRCFDWYSTSTPITRALLLTTRNYSNITPEEIKNNIHREAQDNPISLTKNSITNVNNYELIVKNSTPPFGVITEDTELTIEQNTICNVIKVKLALISPNVDGYNDRILKDYYFTPYFNSGIRRYIERGDIIQINDIEWFVLNASPIRGFINNKTKVLFKYGHTKNDCIEHISRADDKFVHSLNEREENRNTIINTSWPIRFRIWSEYILTSRDWIEVIQNNNENDLLHQQKIESTVQGWPTRRIDQQFHNSIKESSNDYLKKCVICIEEFEVNDEMKTLPCFHMFHKQCVDEWWVNNETCPMCKSSILNEKDDNFEIN